jgi:nitroreductase
MDVLEAIQNRRSIRSYLSKEVEEEKVNVILEAGRWAPSASNKQAWHFIVVRDFKIRKKLAKVHPHGSWMDQSPVVLVVLGDPEKHPKYHLCDPHNAVQNMLLAAYSLGLATCWMGVRDASAEPEFREILDIPENLRVVCAVSVGYSDVDRSSSRQPIESIVSWDKYGN